MLKFMIQKLLHKKWMLASLLIGNILLIAISCSYPMYKNASLQRILTDGFSNYLQEKNTYPFTFELQSQVYKAKATEEPDAKEHLYDTVADTLGIPMIQKVKSYCTVDYQAKSLMERDDKSTSQQLQIAYLSELDKHISIISGEMYSEEVQTDGVIEAIVNQDTFQQLNLIIGEEYAFDTLHDQNNNPIKIKITGVFKNSQIQDNYWVKDVNSYKSTCFISSGIFTNIFIDDLNQDCNMKASWYVLMDYSAIKPEQVSGIMATTKELMEKNPDITVPDYMSLLEDFNQKEKKISMTLMILQIPILALLCTFIFMISGQMLDLEQNEIALLKSRGSSKWQLILIYLLQSAFIAGISTLIAMPIGAFLCMALGSTNAFLEFAQRNTLAIKIDGEVIGYCILAAIISIGIMVLPVYKYASVTIVGYKQKKNKNNKKLWQKLYLDLILLGISLYGLYSFSNQKNLLLTKVMKGEALDPLLYLSSSLFIIGASMFILRIRPLLVWVIYRIGKKRWRPASYTTFQQALRVGYKQNFIMVFLMFTIALGIFNATIARTILTNADNNIKYIIGSDIVEREHWGSNQEAVNMDPSLELVYYEPSFEKYENLKGASSIIKVVVLDKLSATVRSGSAKCKVMGINTKEFGETSWFMDGLLPANYYKYLNALAVNPDGVLVSANFKDLYDARLGDTITYQNDDVSVTGTIYGFVDYWPTYKSQTTTLAINGSMEVTDNFLIVAHFTKLQESFGMRPYQVWMKVDKNSDFIYDFTDQYDISYDEFTDVSEEMKKIREDTVFQGTNGILTMSFIVVLLLSSIGFLIYWILSIKSRELLFGVLRAMGMSKKEIIHMLLYEQLFSTGIALVAGTIIGVIASRFFVPLIQIAYSTNDQTIPLQLITEKSDMLRLFAIILSVMVVCMIVLGRLISKIKISQALKLGED